MSLSRRFILFVDDESSFRLLIGRELERAGYEVEGAAGIAEARCALAQHGFDVVLLDVRMPDGSDLELLPEIREQWPATEVIMLTAFGTVEEAIRAMKQGAYDFLTKPCKLAELEAVLEKAFEKQQLQRDNKALSLAVERLQPAEGVVGASPEMRELFDLVARVARTDTTVLVRGESGVGKEIVARTVHRQSLRADQPFIVVDCASLHENLLQNELFGHDKGAYTDAGSLKRGLFEVANHGTIFLDEIAELTPAVQLRLLRVLQDQTFRRLGGNSDIRLDVRVIAARTRQRDRARPHSLRRRRDPPRAPADGRAHGAAVRAGTGHRRVADDRGGRAALHPPRARTLQGPSPERGAHAGHQRAEPLPQAQGARAAHRGRRRRLTVRQRRLSLWQRGAPPPRPPRRHRAPATPAIPTRYAILRRAARPAWLLRSIALDAEAELRDRAGAWAARFHDSHPGRRAPPTVPFAPGIAVRRGAHEHARRLTPQPSTSSGEDGP